MSDYLTLAVELAAVESDKACLMMESAGEMEYCGIYMEDGEGIITKAFAKLRALFEKIKDWFKAHFGSRKIEKDTTAEVSEDDLKKHKHLKKIAGKLKSGVKNPKVWVSLAALIGAGIGIHKTHKKITLQGAEITRLTKEVNDVNAAYDDATKDLEKTVRELNDTRAQSNERGKKLLRMTKERNAEKKRADDYRNENINQYNQRFNDRQKHAAEVDKLNRQINQLTHDRDSANKHIRDLENMIQNDKAKTAAERDKYEKQLRQAKHDRDSANEKIRNLDNTIIHIKKQHADELDKKNNETSALRRKLGQVTHDRDSANSRVRDLENHIISKQKKTISSSEGGYSWKKLIPQLNAAAQNEFGLMKQIDSSMSGSGEYADYKYSNGKKYFERGASKKNKRDRERRTFTLSNGGTAKNHYNPEYHVGEDDPDPANWKW